MLLNSVMYFCDALDVQTYAIKNDDERASIILHHGSFERCRLVFSARGRAPNTAPLSSRAATALLAKYESIRSFIVVWVNGHFTYVILYRRRPSRVFRSSMLYWAINRNMRSDRAFFAARRSFKATCSRRIELSSSIQVRTSFLNSFIRIASGDSIASCMLSP